MTDKEKIKQAVDLAWQYAQIDGEHHKMWVIDQMVRTLLGEEKYKKWLEERAKEEEGRGGKGCHNGICP